MMAPKKTEITDHPTTKRNKPKYFHNYKLNEKYDILTFFSFLSFCMPLYP